MVMGKPITSYQCIRCNGFVTDATLSTDEQNQQMKEHLDSVHQYWEMEDLSGLAGGYQNNFQTVTSYEYEHYCTNCEGVISPDTKVLVLSAWGDDWSTIVLAI